MTARARIRYLAITAQNPELLARYYATYFGMWLLGESAAGDISLTDGFYNVSLLKQRPELGAEDAVLGTNHFGIEVDDIREVERRLAELSPDTTLEPESGGLHHGEFRVRDPNGLPISLSTEHFHVEHEYRPLPSIRHMALSVPNNDAMLDFYVSVFGFQATTSNAQLVQRVPPITTRMAGDGSTALAILPEPALLDEPADGHRKPGLNHFGILVPDIDDIRRRLPLGTVRKRPANRPFAEYRVVDPEGNQFDVSSKAGFEVDHNVWVRAPD
jgi:catechol 2,3-dioxygenase-like lactoylglutathione lyase family enzyme